MWIPRMSTMLQVLVSIQGLILNTEPFFNEPGYASMKGQQSGETRSKKYNEDTFILSLRTMVYMMKKPPKVRVDIDLLSIFFLILLIGVSLLQCEIGIEIFYVI